MAKYTAEEQRPILRTVALGVQFGSQPVLRNLDLTVQRGETLSIIGESGCGKTVFLKTIVGLVRPNLGRVEFEGRDLGTMRERELARLRLRFGFVFQGAALFDSLTVYENVAFPLRERGRQNEAEIRRVVHARLEEVGLQPEVATRLPAELSGGMKKRVGLARAVALDPDVMLYDEPTTGLDPIMSDVINELVLRMREHRPVTSIVVTHDMKSARKVATRIVMLCPLVRLRAGEAQVIYDGSPEGLEDAPDPRVTQFVRGEARERLREMNSVNRQAVRNEG
jgi:phospholipid/cholesterol/gamma-HCH transport system ATP-binding protein